MMIPYVVRSEAFDPQSAIHHDERVIGLLRGQSDTTGPALETFTASSSSKRATTIRPLRAPAVQ